MGKKHFLIILMVALVILVGCNTNKTSNVELVKLDNNKISSDKVVNLDNIKAPDRLGIMTPCLNKKNQELTIKAAEIGDLLNNSNNLSDQEMEELEETMEKYANEVYELQKQIIRITNPEIIEELFDKIRGLRGEYGNYLREDILRKANYYSVLLFYEDIDLPTHSLEDGYVFTILIFTDNTLVLFDSASDGSFISREIHAQFDYEWFSNQIMQRIEH